MEKGAIHCHKQTGADSLKVKSEMNKGMVPTELVHYQHTVIQYYIDRRFFNKYKTPALKIKKQFLWHFIKKHKKIFIEEKKNSRSNSEIPK